MTVSLICWALWLYDCQFDMLAFVVVYDCQSDMLGFVVIYDCQSDVGLCGRMTVSLIC